MAGAIQRIPSSGAPSIDRLASAEWDFSSLIDLRMQNLRGLDRSPSDAGIYTGSYAVPAPGPPGSPERLEAQLVAGAESRVQQAGLPPSATGSVIDYARRTGSFPDLASIGWGGGIDPLGQGGGGLESLGALGIGGLTSQQVLMIGAGVLVLALLLRKG